MLLFAMILFELEMLRTNSNYDMAPAGLLIMISGLGPYFSPGGRELIGHKTRVSDCYQGTCGSQGKPLQGKGGLKSLSTAIVKGYQGRPLVVLRLAPLVVTTWHP